MYEGGLMADQPADNLRRFSLFWDVIPQGACANRSFCYIWEGGGQVEFFSKITLVFRRSSRREGIGRGCRVQFIILTKISLFLAVAPCLARENRGINFSWKRGGSGLDSCQVPPCFGAFF